MTTIKYELANGTIVNSLVEAKESGLAYKAIFHEDPHGELHPTEPTAKQLESRMKRWEKMTAHFED